MCESKSCDTYIRKVMGDLQSRTGSLDFVPLPTIPHTLDIQVGSGMKNEWHASHSFPTIMNIDVFQCLDDGILDLLIKRSWQAAQLISR